MPTQSTALDTYLQRLPLILDKIEVLRQLADGRFGHDREASTGATSVSERATHAGGRADDGGQRQCGTRVTGK